MKRDLLALLFLALAHPAVAEEVVFQCSSELIVGIHKDAANEKWVAADFQTPFQFTLHGDFSTEDAPQVKYQDAYSVHELTCGYSLPDIWPGLVICGLRFEDGLGRLPQQLVFSSETGRFEFYRGSLGGFAFVEDQPGQSADNSVLKAGTCTRG
ncbi:MAG: hypothetical protein ACON4C_12345 [Henriciella sp.]|jgi:hypothetical protein